MLFEWVRAETSILANDLFALLVTIVNPEDFEVSSFEFFGERRFVELGSIVQFFWGFNFKHSIEFQNSGFKNIEFENIE